MMSASIKTPLEKQYAKLWTNHQLFAEMRVIKNALIGLSPETREAWKTFVGLVFRDLNFQKSQAQMYSSLIEDDKKEVQAAERLLRNRKIRQTEKKFQIFKCGRCSDKGYTGTIELKEGTFKTYCKCELGISLYKDSPQAKIMIERKETIALNKKLKEEKRLREEREWQEQVAAQWKISAEGINICQYCKQGFYGPFSWKYHTGNCG